MSDKTVQRLKKAVCRDAQRLQFLVPVTSQQQQISARLTVLPAAQSKNCQFGVNT
jgi:hypothetical protein